MWRAVEGIPVRVVGNGEPLEAGMRRVRINRKALVTLLRARGVGPERWNEVRAGYVENTGPLSVLLEPWARPATRSDLPRLRGAGT
jgi:uncharacterized membrane protein YcaP (DUF421 family)